MDDHQRKQIYFSQHAFLKKYLGVYTGTAQSWTTIQKTHIYLASMRFSTQISRRVDGVSMCS